MLSTQERHRVRSRGRREDLVRTGRVGSRRDQVVWSIVLWDGAHQNCRLLSPMGRDRSKIRRELAETRVPELTMFANTIKINQHASRLAEICWLTVGATVENPHTPCAIWNREDDGRGCRREKPRNTRNPRFHGEEVSKTLISK